jgi:hypothetical protein
LVRSTLLALGPVPGAGGMPQQMGSPSPGGVAPICVTVDQNAPETVLNLGPVFAAMPGLQHDDGLRLTILSNTNSGLVGPDLSGSSLTLTYTQGQYGTATITVNATDVDLVSVQQTVVVTVRPPSPAGVASVTAIPPPMSMPGGGAR